MKRLLLAGLLVLPFAIARAQQNDAYGSLIGMADSAASDQGPQAGVMPPDRPADDEGPRSPADAKSDSSPAVERTEADIVPPAPAPARRAPSTRRDRSEKSRDDDAPSVAVPAAGAPRVWTKFFSSLMPPMARIRAFEVAASTAARRARPEAPRPATAASDAGAAQGLLELVAAATTPTAPQSAPDR